MVQVRRLVFALIPLLVSLAATAQPAPLRAATSEQQAARYLDRVRGNTALLEPFLRAMPKGTDLHNHLTGAVYAESYIQWAATDGLCVDRKTLVLSPGPCDETAIKPRAASALADPVLYREMIDAFSMRHFSGALESGHDHFFDTFGKFGAVSRLHTGDELAEVVNRAASQNVEYLELILNADRGAGAPLAAKLAWKDGDFAGMREQIAPAHSLDPVVERLRAFLDDSETRARQVMRCGTPTAQPGCATTVRYIAEVYRGLPKEQVFAQMTVLFELASQDKRVVAINPVMPEDGYTALADYDLHMRRFHFLHQLYPAVHLTLHAGELAPGLVPPRRLHDHIRDAIEKGDAERIGHGVDVMQEDNPFELLKLMRDRKVMVEINLTSNDQILGVTGTRHPLPVYMKFGVPVALSTDDEGVARSDITHEYLRAVQSYNLSYADLKKFARTGIEHSFVDDATKAKLRQRLEQDFAAFERQCCQN